jgi:hypothetical protein
MRDLVSDGFGGLVVLVIASVFALIGYSIWFSCTHHCVRSHQAYHEERCSRVSYDINDPGFNIETCSPAGWETVCDQYERNR